MGGLIDVLHLESYLLFFALLSAAPERTRGYIWRRILANKGTKYLFCSFHCCSVVCLYFLVVCFPFVSAAEVHCMYKLLKER